MTEETKSRVDDIKQISADELKAGGFVFQLPEDATEDDNKNFNEALNAAKEGGLNFTINQGVKVIDTTIIPPEPEPVVEPTPEPVVKEEPAPEPKVEEPPKVEAPPQPAPPIGPQYQQQTYYAPAPQFQSGQQQYNYDPFTGMPLKQNAVVPQPVQQQPYIQAQPSYNPQPLQPIGQTEAPPAQTQTGQIPPQQFVYPYAGFNPPQAPPTQNQPNQPNQNTQ